MIEDGEPELEIQVESHGKDHPHGPSGEQEAQALSTKRVPVLAAVVERDGRYLVCRRPAHKRHGGMWEFPGGKLNPGETLADGLKREMWEELRVRAELTGTPLLEVADTGSDFVIIFTPAHFSGEPTPLEHEELRWAEREELQHLAFAPSDHLFVQNQILKLS